MKLTIFQSEKGDCLLLTAADDQHRILIDGGMKASYDAFVAPALGQLAAANKALDLVYVSHIDQDHISGVLKLFNDQVEWRVHDFQVANNNPSHPAPRVPRPPAVGEVWHNAFQDQMGNNTEPIEELLAASAAVFSGIDDHDWQEIASEQTEIATSIKEAIQLSRRLSPEQLSVPLNQQFGGKLAFVRTNQAPPAPIAIGGFQVSVIGPFEDDLNKLRTEWNTWLSENQTTLGTIRRQAELDAERLGTTDVNELLNQQIKQAGRIGDRKKVTTPNLASLMLLVEEGTQTLLLTGDGHANDIIKGLRFHQKLDTNDCMHVDILKIQHHGSEHNMTEVFARTITADHYVFCGNGEHENPDFRVIDKLLDARLGTNNTPPTDNKPFTFWFNSNETAPKRLPARQHMAELQTRLIARQAASNGRLQLNFLVQNDPSLELVL